MAKHHHTGTGIPAAIYCRVSTPGQEKEGTSLDTQDASCRAYAETHGYQVDEAQVYRKVKSGGQLWERPRLTALREAMRQRQVRVIIAHAIDRLAGDPVHLGVILSEAEHYGIEVAFVTEPLDDTPEGQLIRYVRGYAAKVEHTNGRCGGKRVAADQLEQWAWMQMVQVLQHPEIVAQELERVQAAGPVLPSWRTVKPSSGA